MFWTPCAAHGIDLMFEDIGKIPKVDKVIKNGVKVVGYIYNHTFALNLMRKITDNVELVKNGVTRFTTFFLTLQRLQELKSKLREMFTCDEWVSSKCDKDAKGKMATSIILMASFWSDVVYTLKVMAPLVDVLRMVDNERKPAMCYIYAAMGVAKESIEKTFNSNSSKYKVVFDIIDKRWECQLHHPLHSTGYYLNLEYYYEKPEIENDLKLVRGLRKCIETLSESDEVEDKISVQLAQYKDATCLFGIRAAIRQRLTLAPGQQLFIFYLQLNGGSLMELKLLILQLLVVKVLSLGCSASGCERNWSIFEHLEHQRLQDLVFIKYNQALVERFEIRDKIDPMEFSEINYHTQWLVEEMGEDGEPLQEDLVHEDDDLTWAQVTETSGTNEPVIYTRRSRLLEGASTYRA
ncbi:uncharacterized protein LOC127088128 [Lathyrus oleraceus]|uniref:uncharacterized protein LOC127088128 n=1 Tax=Pisum sativum TaxID=3888 RepID=UPI0021D0F95F|nr:uncharacterized protein LOC127088128 [Pisum sativum]